MVTPGQVIADFARLQLGPILHESGAVLYSSADTLQPGRIYFLGTNPGGSPANQKSDTIDRSLTNLASKTDNEYIDGNWNGFPGTYTLQRRVVWLLTNLGLDPRMVAASNLIFVRSLNVKNMKPGPFRAYSQQCWPIHERILELVKPNTLLVFGVAGNSPYTFLKRLFNATDDKKYPAGVILRGPVLCRSFTVPGRFRVIGLPHLSWYDITSHSDVINWLTHLI